MPAYEIEFDLTKDDIVALSLHGAKRRMGTGRRRAIRLLIFAILVVSFLLIMVDTGYRCGPFYLHWPTLLALGAAGFVIAISLLGRPLRISFSRFILKRRGDDHLLGRLKTTVDAAAISQVHALYQSLYRWGAVKRISDTKDYLFLFVSAQRAIILPRRAFSDAIDFECCCRDVRKWQAGLGDEPLDTAIQSVS